MFEFDVAKMTEAIKKGKRIIYSGTNDKLLFFNVRKKESWDPSSDMFIATIRLLVKPGTAGFGYRVMHKSVGYPGKDPKSFVCHKFFDPDAECVLCNYYRLSEDELLSTEMIDFPGKKDGIPCMDRVPITSVLGLLAPGPRMIFTVCEPEFMNNDLVRPELKGQQVWFVDKATLIHRLMEFIRQFPASYFADPKTGVALRVTFTPKNPPMTMHNVFPYMAIPIDPSLAMNATDPEKYTPKRVGNDVMLDKLRDMLPGVKL